MTEADWLKNMDPTAMLTFLRHSGKLSERKARLFAIACCRRIWSLLADERSRKAVEMAEQYADGLVDSERLAEARAGAGAVVDVLFPGHPHPGRREDFPVIHAAEAAEDVADPEPYEPYDEDCDSFLATASSAAYAVGSREGDSRAAPAEQLAQAALLRDFLANPFRPATSPTPAVLKWHDGIVVRLAQAAYDDRLLPSGHLDTQRLAVLADALEEAGADTEMVEHLRGPGPHWRGCFAVDRLLGKG